MSEYKFLVDVPPLEDIPELMLYMLIESLGDFLHLQKRLRFRGEISLTDGLEDDSNAYHDQTLLAEEIRHRSGMTSHEEYMQWYRWWNRWHKRLLSDGQWNELNRLMSAAKFADVYGDWRPEGDWRTYSEA